MSAEQNKALVVRVIEEVFNAHDLDAIDRYYADDYLDHNPQVPAGRVGYRAFFVPLLAAFPDWRGTVHDRHGNEHPFAARTRSQYHWGTGSAAHWAAGGP